MRGWNIKDKNSRSEAKEREKSSKEMKIVQSSDNILIRKRFVIKIRIPV